MADDTHKYNTPQKILDAAMTREKAAHDFYDRLLAHSNVAVITELLETLKDEEYKHIKLIDKLAAEIRMGKHH